MRRRQFITLVGGAAAWPLAAHAQQGGRMRRIGVLMAMAEIDPEGQRCAAAFLKGLAQLGWAPGRNVQIEYRWAADSPVRIKSYAAELVGLRPDVILANSSLVVAPLKQQTHSIPIVFTQITDPVGSGFVTSLAQPGGNITGFTPGEFSMFEKYPEVLKQIAPGVDRMVVLLNPDQSPQIGMWSAIEAVAPSLGVGVAAAAVHDVAEIEAAIESFARVPSGGLIVLANPITTLHRDLIIALATRHRLPAVFPYRYFVTEGGLMSYGSDPADLFQRAASYVDRILRGEQPGDLPVQQPTRFELVINLKTAKALGLTVPPTLLAIADEVIE